jgi:PAS domain S-box-containing protein/diguanylate cyclase (GGDEF)-like protein
MVVARMLIDEKAIGCVQMCRIGLYEVAQPISVWEGGAVSTLTTPLDPGALARLAVESSESAIVSIDRDRLVTTFNPGAERLSGFQAADVLGRDVGVIVPAVGRDVADDLLGRVLTGEPTDKLTTPWRRPDGSVVDVDLVARPVRDDAGAIAGAAILVRDVSARQSARRQLRDSETHARMIVELAHDAYVGMDEDGLISGFNRAAERLFGWSREEVLGRPLAETIIPERMRAQHHAGRHRFLASGEARVAHRPLEVAAIDRSGDEFPIELTLSPVRIGGRWAFNSFIRDLRGRNEAAAAQARLAAIVAATDDAIISTDDEAVITSWNPGAERLYGWSAAEAIGRHAEMLLPPEREGEDRRILARVLAGRVVENLDTEHLHRDGHRIEVSLTVSAMRDGTGTPVGVSAIARETGERLRRARRDEVTGLPTRQVLLERLEMAVADGSAGRCDVAVAVVDIDRFHELNDALGRDGGDAVLRGLVGALTDALPAEAFVGRIGGDQFGIVLEGGDADVLARAVQGALPAVLDVGGVTLHVDASTGLACGPEDAARADHLLGAAEHALRSAKRARSGLERYDRSRAVAGPSVRVAGELRTALEREELVLHFQPQIDIATGRVSGAEGLIRWQHPERGLLLPGAFLPSVERSSLMRSLTVAGLGQALRELRRWQAAGHDLAVSVNLSVLNLLDLEIAHDVARLLGEHGVAASLLRLEITEDSLMVDPQRTAGVLHGLRAMGVELAIDDFGTGYSSLAYLQRLPVSELKIDRCFVRDLATSPSDAAIVRSTIDMGRNLGLRVVAEGVEDAASLEVLRGSAATSRRATTSAGPCPPTS